MQANPTLGAQQQEALALRGRGNASLKEAHPGLEVRAEVAWGGLWPSSLPSHSCTGQGQAQLYFL